MPLSDYLGSGFLPVGVHQVKVMEFHFFDYKTGSKGIEFIVQGEQGRMGISFVLRVANSPKPEKCLWKLARFAQACGLNKNECDRYEPAPPRKDGHEMLLGRRLKVLVEKVGQYSEITEFTTLEGQDPVPGTRPAPKTEVDAIDRADCPF